jgi:hypothetical protein
MALEGTLRDFSLADILQLISLQKKTGLLTLKGAQDAVTLGFSEGRLVSAESGARRMDTRLGTVLVKTQRLAPETLQRALEIQAKTLQRLGFILLKNGFCTHEDLRDGLDIQIRKIVYSLFRWTDGDYIFAPHDAIDYDRETVVPIAVENLLMEGARMQDEWPIIEKVVKSVDLVFTKVPIAQAVVPAEDEDDVEEIGESSIERRVRERKNEPIRVSKAEWAVYQLVDGSLSVAEINERTFLSEFDGCKAVYDLVSRDLIVTVKRAARSPLAEEPTPVPSPSRIRASSPALVAAIAIGAVALLLLGLRVQSVNPLNVLTVPLRRDAIVEGYQKSVSLVRLRRLTEAVDTFYRVLGRFPENMDALINADLVSPSDLYDPWGQKYLYVLQPEKYYLVGFDPEGKTDIDLFFTNNFKVSKSQPAKSKAKSGKEIIIVQ